MQANETKVNKARLNPGQQWIGIDNIETPDEVQPRAKVDFDWVHDLSNFRRDGSEFPPIRVYQLPDARLIAASGHHRIPAMKMAGEEQILCDVVDGTLEEAIVFAAGSNKSNGVKPMGPKDISKAVEMLFAIDAWWNKGDSVVGDHVGCSSSKIRSIRSRIVSSGLRTMPETTLARDGRIFPASRPAHSKSRRPRIGSRKRKDGSIEYYTSIRGKQVFSTNESSVNKKIDEYMEGRRKKYSLIDVGTLLSTRGFVSAFGAQNSLPGFIGYWRHGITCVGCDFSSDTLLPLAIGRLIAARRYKGDLTARMIVLCYPEDGPAKVLDLYRQEGFEFLTPDELIESLKSE